MQKLPDLKGPWIGVIWDAEKKEKHGKVNYTINQFEVSPSSLDENENSN